MTKTVMSLPIPTTPLSQANSSSQEEKPNHRIQGPQQRQVEELDDDEPHAHDSHEEEDKNDNDQDDHDKNEHHHQQQQQQQRRQPYIYIYRDPDQTCDNLIIWNNGRLW